MIDFGEFATAYENHLRWLGLPSPGYDNLLLLHSLHTKVSENGGWARTIGHNNWNSLSPITNPRKLFEQSHLVSFERKLAGSWAYDSNATKEIDYSLLKTIPITRSIRADQWDEILSEDLVLFRSVFDLGISTDLISMSSLKEKHGDVEIMVMVQQSDTSGFSVKTSSMQTMPLKKYLKIMERSPEHESKIRFAVNIDFGTWHDEIDSLRKSLPAQILWCSEEDSLKYLRQHILGMSLPQLYLKINGCWTGGHEENLRFSAANINHGPSDCEWWGLHSSQALQLREIVKVDKEFEIFRSETLWWPDEIYCIANGLTVYHVMQEPGDLILVGPGTIHWVKSCGVTTNTAWNFGPKLFNNFVRSFERDWINKAIEFKSLVPMHVLAMDLLNSEVNTLDFGLVELLRDQIRYKNQEEMEICTNSALGPLQLNNSDNVINCENCYAEMFRVYYKCNKCANKRLKGIDEKCFFCYECATKIHAAVCKSKIAPVQKFSEKMFDMLEENIERRCKGEKVSPIPELIFPFDKDEEEGIYISKHNGVYQDIPYPVDLDYSSKKKQGAGARNETNKRHNRVDRESIKDLSSTRQNSKPGKANSKLVKAITKEVENGRLTSRNFKKSMSYTKVKLDLRGLIPDIDSEEEHSEEEHSEEEHSEDQESEESDEPAQKVNFSSPKPKTQGGNNLRLKSNNLKKSMNYSQETLVTKRLLKEIDIKEEVKIDQENDMGNEPKQKAKPGRPKKATPTVSDRSLALNQKKSTKYTPRKKTNLININKIIAEDRENIIIHKEPNKQEEPLKVEIGKCEDLPSNVLPEIQNEASGSTSHEEPAFPCKRSSAMYAPVMDLIPKKAKLENE